jgi:hypothetical protein
LRILIVSLVLAGVFLFGVMVSFLANATNKQVIYGRRVAGWQAPPTAVGVSTRKFSASVAINRANESGIIN